MTPPAGTPDLPANTLVCDDADAVAREAARRMIVLVGTRQVGPVAICLSGGSTPRRLYALLAESHSGDLPWERLHWFFGDERLVPHDHPDSNFRMARQAMFARIAVPPGNIHPIGTDATSPDEAARSYENVLAAFYGTRRLDPSRPLFDVTLAGLGEDGHTASLFPGSLALDERQRLAVGVERAGQPPYIPRITLTLPALASSRAVLFLVSGAAKHPALTAIASGERLPAGLLATDSRAAWLVDRAAATGEAT